MKKSKVMELPEIKYLKKYLEEGMISLLDMAGTIARMYDEGTLSYDEANEAVKKLARIKVR